MAVIIKSSICLLLISIGMCECGTLIPKNRIVGGVNSNIANHPYQVSIQHLDTLLCGGSIIKADFILTAAHCTAIEEVQASTLKVRAGSSYYSSGGQLKRVAQIIQHPGFNVETFDYDISLLRLSEKLILDPKLSTAIISLPPAGAEIEGNLNGVCTGWGRLSQHGAIPLQLQEVVLPTLRQSDCLLVYGNRVQSERMFCAGFPDGGKDTCQGDSGGPFVYDGVQLGVTSWGDGCGDRNSPGVYAKLSAFVDYINQHAKN